MTPTQQRSFPNVASRDKSIETVDRTDIILRAELERAGIQAVMVGNIVWVHPEVHTRVRGSLRTWGFQRAWRYWIATGPGIPVELAERLHAGFGTECRVDGHCRCPSPREWFEGFGIGLYHVDTQEALNALADEIRNVR